MATNNLVELTGNPVPIQPSTKTETAGSSSASRSPQLTAGRMKLVNGWNVPRLAYCFRLSDNAKKYASFTKGAARQGDRLCNIGKPVSRDYPVREAAINARKRACAADEERRQGRHGHGSLRQGWNLPAAMRRQMTKFRSMYLEA